MTSKARGLADLGNAFDDGALSNRNLIINGAMQISQRGTSFTSSGGFTLDRWYANQNSSTTTYTDSSGQKWLDFTNNGGTFANVNQKIENGLYLARNKDVTLSFDWEEVTAGTTAEVRFYNNDDLDSYVAISNPNVSERKTVTFSVGNVGNGAGGWLGIAFYNTTSTGGSGRFRISNVQLEVGDTATPFEHRSYGQELALCQRYFEKSYNQGTAIGTATHLGSRSSGGNAAANTTGEIGGYFPFIVAKRTAPSVTIWDQSGNQGKTTISLYGTGTTANQTSSVSNISETVFFVSRSSGSNATELYVQFAADAEL